MKQIFFGRKANNGAKNPFWMPWGLGGCLGRLFLFMLLLFLLLLLISLFKGHLVY